MSKPIEGAAPKRDIHYPDADYALAAVRAIRLWVSGGRSFTDPAFQRAVVAAAEMLR